MIIRQLRPLALPLIILAVMVITFGLMIPELGFYLDDWPNVYFDEVGGNEATLLFHANDGRPLKGWYPVALFDLFGYSPLPWQIFNFALRYLTVIFAWLVFRSVWPGSSMQVGIAAILFSVYPVFAQHPIAVTFIPQWTTFLCVFLSFYLMILGVKKPKWAILFYFLAMLISAIGLVISDYFIALEFVRPIILWLLNPGQKNKFKQKIIDTGLRYLPFLAVVAVYVVWRWFFASLPGEDRLEVSLLSALAAAPIKETFQLVMHAAQDFLYLVVAAWYKTFQPGMLDITGPAEIGALAISVFLAAFVYLSIVKTTSLDAVFTSADKSEWKQRLFLASLMVILGAVPGWLIGRQVSDPSGIWNDRFGMASMAGASLLVVSLTEKLFSSEKWRLGFLAVLVGLAAGWQVRNLNDYRWSWTYQKRFYNQLIWRIPSLEPDTLFLSDREAFAKVGVYPTAFAINTLYPQSRDTDQVDYWFLTIQKYFGDDFENFTEGGAVKAGHWQAWFSGNSSDSIVFDFRGDSEHCLWVLGPEDALNPFISDITRSSLTVSDLSRISTQSTAGYPKWGGTGMELPNDWCYYFEKADLAQQRADWETIQTLWNQSSEFHSGANSGVEFVPFIDGFIHLSMFEQAIDLTKQAKVYDFGMNRYLCSVWENGLAGQVLDSNQIALVNEVASDLDCTWQD